jgi:uncharacterized protein (TIGR03435 family)
MLEERDGLKVHRESRQLPVYQLVVASHGPRLSRENGGSGCAGQAAGTTLHIARGLLASCKAMTMAQLATLLSREVDRMVIDRTGLSGGYMFTLEWTPERGPAPPRQEAAASLFTAVQDQLGLKLEPARVPVDVIVIDHIEPPTED